ncbi:hypothetical protein B0G57_14113 [Trinickia symbiotica]|uniref:Multi-ubiquitin domain-containing protein n=1 Tax=Trinickia symbiotica TaxID=863227 RepID=A0A2N7WKL2_9BURK|nr:hypothetical protein [Trinickia symbiotica]PMS29881.1 hypothetical protein C0Z20_30460 [Trinickia symbiotica]PPK41085.1 hypothetical protein B0G57_14113 [Trinickia symbiotica]
MGASETVQSQAGTEHETGPQRFVVIEGVEMSWGADTITTEQIAELGGWDPKQGVIEVDEDNNERTLAPREVVEIKPGHGFGKKHRWKRGLMRDRLAAEFELLKGEYADAEHLEHNGEDWFRLPQYRCPPGWQLGEHDTGVVPVTFKIAANYPVGEPYGFAVPMEFSFRGAVPTNAAATVTPPFGDTWRLFSWAPDGWFASDDLHKGSNLLRWANSFHQRLLEGA